MPVRREPSRDLAASRRGPSLPWRGALPSASLFPFFAEAFAFRHGSPPPRAKALCVPADCGFTRVNGYTNARGMPHAPCRTRYFV